MASAHPLNQLPDYAAASARLRAKMAALGIPLPAEKVAALDKAILDAFDRPCFAYVAALQQPPTNVWHAIEIGAAGEKLLTHQDELSVAMSLTDALAFALGEMDDERIFPDAVIVQDGTVEFKRKGASIMRISPIVYEPADATARARVDTTLKGFLRYGDRERLFARLLRLPGLEDLVNAEAESRHKTPRGTVLNRTAADLAARLRSLFSDELGIKVKQHQALELTAALFGAASWQHVVAHEAEAHCFLEPIVVETYSPGVSPVRLFFRTTSEAVWGFARAMRAAKASDPDVKPTFYGAGLGGTALYLSTFGSLGADEPHLKVATWAPSQIGYSLHYEGMVKNLLLGGGGLQDGLERMLEIKSGVDSRLRASNARMGISPNRVMTIKDLTFSVRAREDSSREYLHVERLDSDGGQLAAGVTAIYKASIRKHATTGQYVVVGDYDRDLVFSLDGFTEEDAVAVGEFAGLHVKNSRWTPSGPGFSDTAVSNSAL